MTGSQIKLTIPVLYLIKEWRLVIYKCTNLLNYWVHVSKWLGCHLFQNCTWWSKQNTTQVS